eukprot:scaffold23711_cov34-Attheya_sp.AAC.2
MFTICPTGLEVRRRKRRKKQSWPVLWQVVRQGFNGRVGDKGNERGGEVGTSFGLTQRFEAVFDDFSACEQVITQFDIPNCVARVFQNEIPDMLAMTS